jgi:hypothetical protein
MGWNDDMKRIEPKKKTHPAPDRGNERAEKGHPHLPRGSRKEVRWSKRSAEAKNERG